MSLTRTLALGVALAVAAASGTPLQAHSTPFSYVDVRLDSGAVKVEVVAHVVDVAHELGIGVPESLLERPLPPQVGRLGALLQRRLRLSLNGQPIACSEANRVDVVPDMQSLHWFYSCARAGNHDVATATGPLFPYDPQHHTFVNVYVDGALRAQTDLTGVPQTTTLQLGAFSPWQTVRRLTLAGVQHILGGLDHLLFLVGLLLTGGSLRRLVTIVTAFTLSHSITLAAAVMGIITPPPSVVEPLIALSIIAVGIDNFHHGLGHDRRALAAGAFGLIHGFGFASVLQEMRLARGDLAWSLLSFNIGVELGQVSVVIGVAWLFARIRQLGPVPAGQLVTWGSSLVIVAGAFWFVERVAAAL